MAHPLAGKAPTAEMLINVQELQGRYHSGVPDAADAQQRVAFGTSGHRGSAARNSFNEAHILCITQAIAEYRAGKGITGPLFVGMDTHALSEPAQRTVLEVLAAHDVDVRYAANAGATPTPVISHAILCHNRAHPGALADGIVITPSHNPPEDGGIKYNPPDGGPADTAVTRVIEERANALLVNGGRDVKRTKPSPARSREYDFITPYVNDLGAVVDMEAIARSGIKLGVDPLGGSNLAYWDPIVSKWGLNLVVVNRTVDPTFAFMAVDHDGKIRMDCSSPHAMANLVRLKDDYALAFGNDTDSDRHGIVTPRGGLMNPNHFLAVSIRHLFSHRPGWAASCGIGKTLVSSALIDRVAADLGRRMVEVPVGFKWFVGGLADGSLGFGGEESAGASFLRRDGTAWSTDKDGIIMDLLAAEILAVTGKDPAQHLEDLQKRFGAPRYTRVDQAATPAQKKVLGKLSPESVKADTLAGERITARLTRAPGNDAPIGGLKVTTENGWFAARPSGTEDVYKIYAESFRDDAHLQRILDEAREIVSAALATA